MPGKTEVQMNTKTKLSLVAILASCFAWRLAQPRPRRVITKRLWLVLPSQAL